MTAPDARPVPRMERLSAAALAQRLGMAYPPTLEQAAIIESPLTPSVVIAGAGSGKTETMAARVVYLVANGLIAPERVLGLTFTRKAAAELAIRIRSRLSIWRRIVDPRQEDPLLDGEPTVLTYAAYAGRLVAEHALRVGAEPDAMVLSQARRWQLADQVVRRYDGEIRDGAGAPSTITAKVMALAGDLAEHLSSPGEIKELTDGLLAQLELLTTEKAFRKRWPLETGDLPESLQDRRNLLPLIERFLAAKRATGRGAMDFGDQMSMAAELALIDEVREAERARFGVVLLDEYQDTGHAQATVLRGLFGAGHPVTAVGDPFQAIYGWRGASAGTIERFAAVFPQTDGARASVFTLSTSFRNDQAILRVANDVAVPLRDVSPDTVTLQPRPGADGGSVTLALVQTVEDEAQWIAARMLADWNCQPEGNRTAAVLVRRRADIPAIEWALTDAGLMVDVVDLGGLLSTPEVIEVISTLRVLHDHRAGASLMRLLTGARWRIGPSDISALADRARYLSRPADDSAERNPDDAVGLVEALDDLGGPARYSAEGFARLEALCVELRGLRARAGVALPELVADVERTIGVALEVASRPDRAATGRVHLDRFLDEVVRFTADADLSYASGSGGPPGLGAFLAYLEAVDDEDNGWVPGEIAVAKECVQILTVHGAKGLEWDVVALAGLADGVFPAASRGGVDWTKEPRLLPTALRGDRDDLPALDLGDVTTLRELDSKLKVMRQGVAARQAIEERRLLYVALTRARRAIYAVGSVWGATNIKVRGPSPFLLELKALAEQDALDGASGAGRIEVTEWSDPARYEKNPLLADVATGVWPFDPLRARRGDVAAGADVVRAAMAELAANPVETIVPEVLVLFEAGPQPDENDRPAQWSRDIDLLLRERAALRAPAGDIEVQVPDQLSVSQLVTLRADPAALARQIRRPMPSKPAPLARRGTAFHLWLERRWSMAPLVDIDELPGSADPDPAEDTDLDALRASFESSEWAGRQPHEVEVPFDTVIGAVVVRGRIDAVFREPDSSPVQWTVVDWKTGARPTGAAAEAAAIQLGAYRLAWADLQGIDPAQVAAAFHYVRSNETVRIADPLTAGGLAALLRLRPATS
jgi:DNA helicase-2/ATP-dependent DNA helicase PcrA